MSKSIETQIWQGPGRYNSRRYVPNLACNAVSLTVGDDILSYGDIGPTADRI
jgi:hypothetical protein